MKQKTCKNCGHDEKEHKANNFGFSCAGDTENYCSCKKFEEVEMITIALGPEPEHAKTCPCPKCKKPKNHSPLLRNKSGELGAREGCDSLDAKEGTFNLSEKIQDRKYPKPIWNTRFTLDVEDVKTFVKKDKNINPKELAKLFHDMYEDQAERVGWKTQEECRVEFKNLPKKNKEVMLLVVKAVIRYLNKRTDKLAGEELSK